MNERPKTPYELAIALASESLSNPEIVMEMMKEKGKDNSSPLADLMEKTTTRKA